MIALINLTKKYNDFPAVNNLNLVVEIGIIHKGSLVATGTAEDLKSNIQNKSADLEEIFINLTEE